MQNARSFSTNSLCVRYYRRKNKPIQTQETSSSFKLSKGLDFFLDWNLLEVPENPHFLLYLANANSLTTPLLLIGQREPQITPVYVAASLPVAMLGMLLAY